MKDLCIIVDPLSTSTHLPAALIAHGFRVILFFSCQNNKNIFSQVNKILRLPSCVIKNQQWPAQVPKNEVRVIIAGTDASAPIADAFSNDCEIPYKNNFKLSIARRNKYYMIQKVRESGLLHYPQAICKSPDDIVKFFKHVKPKKIVLKPLEGMGSDQVYFCNSSESAAATAKKILGKPNIFGDINNSVLIQEFVIGEEFMVDTVSVQGKHKVIALWTSCLGNNERPQPLYANALDESHFLYKSLKHYISNILDCLGVQNGPAHTEVKVNDHGEYSLIELNPRFHGSMDILFASSLYGTNQVIETTMSIASPEHYLNHINQGPKLNMQGKKVYLQSHRSGAAVSDLVSDDFKDIPSFFSLSSRVKKGSKIVKTNSLSTCPGTIFLTGDARSIELDYREVLAREKTIINRLLGAR